MSLVIQPERGAGVNRSSGPQAFPSGLRSTKRITPMLIDDQGEITPPAFCFDVGMKVADL
jgi:hypothetical protein